MSLVEDFKVFAKLISRYKLYDIASALRGCDVENVELKEIFTARIRYYATIYATGEKASFLGVIRTYKEIFIEDIERILEEDLSKYAHYLAHVNIALFALRDIYEEMGDVEAVRELEFLYNLSGMLQLLVIADRYNDIEKMIDVMDDLKEFIEHNSEYIS